MTSADTVQPTARGGRFTMSDSSVRRPHMPQDEFITACLRWLRSSGTTAARRGASDTSITFGALPASMC